MAVCETMAYPTYNIVLTFVKLCSRYRVAFMWVMCRARLVRNQRWTFACRRTCGQKPRNKKKHANATNTEHRHTYRTDSHTQHFCFMEPRAQISVRIALPSCARRFVSSAGEAECARETVLLPRKTYKTKKGAPRVCPDEGARLHRTSGTSSSARSQTAQPRSPQITWRIRLTPTCRKSLRLHLSVERAPAYPLANHHTLTHLRQRRWLASEEPYIHTTYRQNTHHHIQTAPHAHTTQKAERASRNELTPICCEGMCGGVVMQWCAFRFAIRFLRSFVAIRFC